jgi:hypothetical protein
VDSGGNILATLATNTGASDNLLSVDFTLLDQDIYIQASFIAQEYTVEYRSNGGNSTPNKQVGLIGGTSISLAPKIYKNDTTETGYTITVKSNGGS